MVRGDYPQAEDRRVDAVFRQASKMYPYRYGTGFTDAELTAAAHEVYRHNNGEKVYEYNYRVNQRNLAREKQRVNNKARRLKVKKAIQAAAKRLRSNVAKKAPRKKQPPRNPGGGIRSPFGSAWD